MCLSQPLDGHSRKACKVSVWRAIHQAAAWLVRSGDRLEQILENTYMQFFFGFANYSSKALFEPAMMVHFR